MAQKEFLQENEVDKIKFYYEGSALADNIYTACVFINSKKNRIEARGVSICSLRDTFKRKDGKNRAFGRAIKALRQKKNSKKINATGREGEFVNRLFKIRSENDDDMFISTVGTELSSFDPNTPVTIINGDNKYVRKYVIKVPAHYPITKTNKKFKYKSSYRPNPACKEEIELLNIEA